MSTGKMKITASKSLLDTDSEPDDDVKIKVNKKYAADFQNRKQKEELRKVRFENGGEDNDDASSSSSSSEDEDGDLLTEKVDVDIMKTINALRSKDSRIYNHETCFFEQEVESEEEDTDNERKAKPKQKRYKDVVREQILEQMEAEEKGLQVTEADDDGPSFEEYDNPSRFAYDAEQQKLRKSFLESAQDDEENDSSDGKEDDGDNWMTRKPKKTSAPANDEKSEQNTRQELLAEMRKLEESLENRKSEIVDPRGEVKDGEAFLLNYFKNKAWVDKDDGDDDDDRSIGEPDQSSKRAITHEDKNDDDDDGADSDVSLDQLEKADDFEAQYNFRFEEAAAATAQSGADFSLIGHGRGEGMKTLRRKDETRREKRLARKERKAFERKAKEEQLKRLKNAKRQEMEEKMKQVKAVLGEVEGRGAPVDEAAIMKLMEGDFDPEKFEKLMEDMYGDQFYQQEDSGWRTDKDVRETLRHDEDGDLLVGQDDVDGGLYDNVEEEEEEEEEEETSRQEGDDDYDDGDWPEDEGEYEEQEQASELETKLKARMMDELYKLDYEDIVAGQPTRFKYRKVTPNNYGLSTEEILFARDSTLKQFVSLKKMAPYREEEEYNAGSRKRRRFRDLLKHDIEEQMPTEPSTELDDTTGPLAEGDGTSDVPNQLRKKNRRLKKGKKKVASTEPSGAPPDTKKEPTLDGLYQKMDISKQAETESDTLVEQKSANSETVGLKKTRKRKKKTKKALAEGVSEARLASYGL